MVNSKDGVYFAMLFMQRWGLCSFLECHMNDRNAIGKFASNGS